MKNENDREDGYVVPHEEKLICVSCEVELVPTKVTVSYLDGSFPVEILSCPKCGYSFISEELAVNKMLRVEQELEDK